jgi:hypothetical protein
VESGIADTKRVELTDGIGLDDTVIIGPYRSLDQLKDGKKVALSDKDKKTTPGEKTEAKEQQASKETKPAEQQTTADKKDKDESKDKDKKDEEAKTAAARNSP